MIASTAMRRVADAVLQGHKPPDHDHNLLGELAYELSLDEGEFWTHVVPADFAGSCDARWDLLDYALSEDRVEELNKGAEPTGEEMSLLNAATLQRLFEEPDDDIIPGLWTIDLEGERGSAIAVVSCYGYSYSFLGMKRELIGAYRTRDEAYRALSSQYLFPE